METSYFAKSGREPNAVAVTVRKPKFFKGKHYRKLAPPKWLLQRYRKDSDQNFYRKIYIRDVLNNLEPRKVYEELGENAILVCWEGIGKFCHRHIVAEWLMNNLGVEIKEID